MRQPIGRATRCTASLVGRLSRVALAAALLHPAWTSAQALRVIGLDDQFRAFQDFAAADSVVIVLPDTPFTTEADSHLVARLNFFGSKGVFRRESQLTPSDYRRHLMVVGPWHQFTAEDLLSIPIGRSDHGFILANRVFSQPDEAFFYLNDTATRLYAVGNTWRSLDAVRRHVLGAYSLYVFRGDEMVLSGTCRGAACADSINDLEAMRKSYFTSTSSGHLQVYYPQIADSDAVHQQVGHALETYLGQLADALGEDVRTLAPINVYIYANRADLQAFLGVPMTMQMWGLSVNNVIHSENAGLETLKHEVTHSFIRQAIGDNSNNFLVEGFRQYTEYLFDSTVGERDRDSTRAHLLRLTPALTSGNPQEFFSHPSSYPISGVFVQYLVDTFGLDSFKSMYSTNALAEELKKRHGVSIEDLIGQFRQEAGR